MSGAAVPGAVDDPAQVVGDDVSFAGAGGDEVRAYLAKPASGAPGPGLLILPIAFGLSDHYRDLARRFANIGYTAMSVDPYSREGAPDPADIAEVTAKMFAIPDARMTADLEAAAERLLADEGSNGDLACLGFSAGARQALVWACQTTRLGALGACYAGFLSTATPDAEKSEARPTPVVELLPGLACPLLLVGGALDEGPSPGEIEDVAARARAAGKDVTVTIYDGVGHAFFSDDQDWAYQPDAAARLWEQLTAFFASHLGATS
jgi:carboxymethylenebutenolidase